MLSPHAAVCPSDPGPVSKEAQAHFHLSSTEIEARWPAWQRDPELSNKGGEKKTQRTRLNDRTMLSVRAKKQ